MARSQKIESKVSRAEKGAIIKAAESKEISTAEFIREAALKAADKVNMEQLEK